jgi:hypothetical protein
MFGTDASFSLFDEVHDELIDNSVEFSLKIVVIEAWNCDV